MELHWNYHTWSGGYSFFRTAQPPKKKNKGQPGGQPLHSSVSQGIGDKAGEPAGREKRTGLKTMVSHDASFT